MKVSKELKKAIPDLIENKYFDKYCTLIEAGLKPRDLDEYELHHYIPNSIYPNSNLVALTLREHFVAHVFLTKFLSGEAQEKMLYAINMMLDSKKYPVTSHSYASLKSKFYDIKHRKIYVQKHTYSDGGVALDFTRTPAVGQTIAEYNSINDMLSSDPITAYHPDDEFKVYHPLRGLTLEAKQAIGAANSVHQSGEGNSQFGTMWVYSDAEQRSKKIRSTDPIPTGWQKGRKIKFED